MAPLQHLTLASQNPKALEAFYIAALGFVASDYALGEVEMTAAIWMRSNHQYHALACFRRKTPSIGRFSFEAGDGAAMKDWCDRIGDRRIPVIWGPGRHGPVNNHFIFVEDRERNWIEISAELEVIYDRPLVIWPAEPYTLTKWVPAISHAWKEEEYVMRMAMFDAASPQQVGIVHGEHVITLSAVLPDTPSDMVALIRDWDKLRHAIDLSKTDAGIPLAGVTLLAPVERLGKVLAIGLNYADHIAETNNKPPEHQLWFSKASSSSHAPFAPIEVPLVSAQVAWPDRALDHDGRRSG